MKKCAYRNFNMVGLFIIGLIFNLHLSYAAQPTDEYWSVTDESTVSRDTNESVTNSNVNGSDTHESVASGQFVDALRITQDRHFMKVGYLTVLTGAAMTVAGVKIICDNSDTMSIFGDAVVGVGFLIGATGGLMVGRAAESIDIHNSLPVIQNNDHVRFGNDDNV